MRAITGAHRDSTMHRDDGFVLDRVACRRAHTRCGACIEAALRLTGRGALAQLGIEEVAPLDEPRAAAFDGELLGTTR
jgi:hypothetical protein